MVKKIVGNVIAFVYSFVSSMNYVHIPKNQNQGIQTKSYYPVYQ